MSLIARAKREDLFLMAEELGLDAPPDITRTQLQKLVLESDKNFVESRLKVLAEEQERLWAKEKEELDREERRQIREFELEKIRLTNAQTSTCFKPKIELRNLIHKFEEHDHEISLYLLQFERQAKWAQIEKKDWIFHLLGLLPYEITQLIAREPAEEAENYDHVKKLLLGKFKLSPEKFRQKFVKHQRRNDSNWKEFAYELKNYFVEWISGLEIKSFDQLIDLMVTDQIKKRVPPEIQSHFLDEWASIVSPSDLCVKLDAYEEIQGRDGVRKKEHYGKSDLRTKPASEIKVENDKKWKNQGLSYTNPRRANQIEDMMEKRKKPQCYECGSIQHLRYNCPEFKRKTEQSASLNRIGDTQEDIFLKPFISSGEVNGLKMPILRDTGSSIDIICQKYITPEMLTGEHVWVQQPLDVTPTCLQLAEVELSCEKGNIITKAAVIREELDQGRYILGNRSACMLEEDKCSNYQMNAVQFKNQEELKGRFISKKPVTLPQIVPDDVLDEDLEIRKSEVLLPPVTDEEADLSSSVKREFKEVDQVLVLPITRVNKIVVQWMSPDKIESKMMSDMLSWEKELTVPYLDDVARFSNTWEEHLKHFDWVSQRIQEANLPLEPSKNGFAKDHEEYLEHVIGQDTKTPGEMKTRAIRDFPTPKTKTEVRAFLGLAGYYRQDIPMLSVIATPITDTLEGRSEKDEMNWISEYAAAFQELKNRFTNEPVRYVPDFSRKLLLETDASEFGMGAVLSQNFDADNENPIVFLSKIFSDTEKKYCTTKKECADIGWTIRKLHCYLDVEYFIIQIDHNPLMWLSSNVSSNPRLMYFVLALQPYNFEVIQQRRVVHKNSEILSGIT